MRFVNFGWAAICLFTSSVWPLSVQASQQPRPAIALEGSADGIALSQDAGRLARWVIGTGDHQGLPFGIVDKRTATIVIYTADGSLAGTSAALLGQTLGDASLAGVGERTQNGSLRPEDLTTPAGRFVSEPGRNDSGERIVWVDYGTAFAIHRLRPGASRQHRAERLASNDARRRRVSAGCVVVPEAFYDEVIAPLLGRSRGLVYVLPESGGLPLGAIRVSATRILD